MPVAARPVFLTAAEHRRLTKTAWGHKSEFRARLRVQIVLLAARGHSNAAISRHLGVAPGHRTHVAGRFAAQGLAGLEERKRSGRPSTFTPLQTAQVTARACQLPAETGVPLSRWSCLQLAREAVEHGIATFVSASTVRRWLARDAIKPWQHRS